MWKIVIGKLYSHAVLQYSQCSLAAQYRSFVMRQSASCSFHSSRHRADSCATLVSAPHRISAKRWLSVLSFQQSSLIPLVLSVRFDGSAKEIHRSFFLSLYLFLFFTIAINTRPFCFYFADSEYEEEQTPRYRPDSLASLCRATRFTEAELKRIYRGFKAECPTGVVREETFKCIYSKFFPQGGEISDNTIIFPSSTNA